MALRKLKAKVTAFRNFLKTSEEPGAVVFFKGVSQAEATGSLNGKGLTGLSWIWSPSASLRSGDLMLEGDLDEIKKAVKILQNTFGSKVSKIERFNLGN